MFITLNSADWFCLLQTFLVWSRVFHRFSFCCVCLKGESPVPVPRSGSGCVLKTTPMPGGASARCVTEPWVWFVPPEQGIVQLSHWFPFSVLSESTTSYFQSCEWFLLWSLLGCDDRVPVFHVPVDSVLGWSTLVLAAQQHLSDLWWQYLFSPLFSLESLCSWNGPRLGVTASPHVGFIPPDIFHCFWM